MKSEHVQSPSCQLKIQNYFRLLAVVVPWKTLRSGLFDLDSPAQEINHLPHITCISEAKEKIVLRNVKTMI